MPRILRSTSLQAKDKPTLTPASSLSSVDSSKSFNSSDTTSRSCSSTNLSLFTSNSQLNLRKQAKSNQLSLKDHRQDKSAMVVNPVITHHPQHTSTAHHLLSNRIIRSTSIEQLNPFSVASHNCLVKCVCLGQTSGEVFASVGNDNQIKLWAIGNTKSLVSLKSRNSIECVQFSRNEEVLATGSLKGIVQIWDLNSKNVIRTFRGHTSTIKSLDFFPSGDFLTSGSADCTIKLWDSRKNDCVHTYDEHEKPITCQVFSPDGKWLASADSESLKIWDLTACKKIADLKAHTGAITDIKFHPTVLIMASSSLDGTICWWELEHFKLIGRISANAGNSSSASSGYVTSSSCSSTRSTALNKKVNDKSTDSLNNAVHKMIFMPNGYQLFATAKDKYILCDVYNEPELNGLINLNFGIGRDLAFNEAGIIIASHQKTYVSLQQIKWGDLEHFSNFDRQNSANSTSSRRNFDQGQLRQTHLKLEMLSSKYNDLKSAADDNGLDSYSLGFVPKRELSRTPLKPESKSSDKTILTGKSVDEFQKQLMDLKISKGQSINECVKLPAIQNRVQPQPQHAHDHHLNNQQESTMPSNQPTNNSKLNQTHVNRVRGNVPKSISLRKISAVVQPVQSKSNNQKEFKISNFGKVTPSAVVYPDSHHPLGHHKHHDSPKANYHELKNSLSNVHPLSNNSLSINNLSCATNVEPFKELDNLSISHHFQSNLNLIPSNVNLTLNLNEQKPSLSSSLGNLSRNTVLNVASKDPNESIAGLLVDHNKVKKVLTQRKTNLKCALNTWNEDIEKGYTFANSTEDKTIVADLVKLSINRPESNMDDCQISLPQIDNLLRSKQEGCVDAALVALEFIMENFLDIIKQNITKHPSIGVDLHREERCKKSMDCFTQLVRMRAFINKQQCLVGQLGIQFRRLSLLMERIDAK